MLLPQTSAQPILIISPGAAIHTQYLVFGIRMYNMIIPKYRPENSTVSNDYQPGRLSIIISLFGTTYLSCSIPYLNESTLLDNLSIFLIFHVSSITVVLSKSRLQLHFGQVCHQMHCLCGNFYVKFFLSLVEFWCKSLFCASFLIF